MTNKQKEMSSNFEVFLKETPKDKLNGKIGQIISLNYQDLHLMSDIETFFSTK